MRQLFGKNVLPWHYRALPIIWGLAGWKKIGATLATVDKSGTVALQETLVTSLAQTDAVAKLLIEKELITQDEFMETIKKAESATCDLWGR